MLESMRKHAQGWVAKVILGGIILSFALWGIGDYFTGNQLETVAEIDGEAIYDSEFVETYNRQLNTYRNMLGEKFDKEMADKLGVKDETIQTMINRRLMLKEANALGLVVPDQAVLGTVQTDPAFQEAKSFSSTRYQNLIRQMGFASPRDYENYLRQSILIDTLQQSVMKSATISEAEVMEKFRSKFEKRVISAIIVNPKKLMTSVQVSDEQAREWYDTHASRYQSPLKVEIDVVEIDAADLIDNIVVTDADVEAAYEDRQSEFSSPEKRRISHILVPLAQDASPEVVAMAEAEIAKVQERLAAGESFAKVAKEVSKDPAAAQGGDLGLFEQGAMLPEFEEAVFNQLNKGEVSGVLRTQFGLHLVQLNEVVPANVKPLSEVRDALAERLRTQMASDEAFRLSQDLDNALGMEDSLAAAAKSVNLKLQRLGKLTADNVLANATVGSSKDLQKQAFTMMPGDAVELVEVEQGHFVALEVTQRVLPETMPYEDVVKLVYSDVREAGAKEKAQELADEILAAAKSGQSIDDLAQKFAQPKYISKPVLPDGEGDDAVWLQSVISSAFRAPEKNWVDSTLYTDEGVAVVYVNAVEKADESKFAAEKESVREEALQSKGSVRFARWLAAVRDRHQISVNNRVLSRF